MLRRALLAGLVLAPAAADAGEAERRFVEHFMADCFRKLPDLGAIEAQAAADGWVPQTVDPARADPALPPLPDMKVWIVNPDAPDARAVSVSRDESGSVMCSLVTETGDPEAIRAEVVAAFDLGTPDVVGGKGIHDISSWQIGTPPDATLLLVNELTTGNGLTVNVSAFRTRVR